MSRLVTALANYREYHRDGRNVATHALGIPLIVFAIEVLLSRPVLDLGGWPLTPALVASVLATAWYLRLDWKFGLALGAVLLAFALAGLRIAQAQTLPWLMSGLVPFIAGWTLQLVGHGFEGRKPAFLDDIRSLLVGPLFVIAEAAFALGLRGEVRAQVERATR